MALLANKTLKGDFFFSSLSCSFATEYDLEAEEYVPLPKGEVHKRKEIVQDVTLHDLDVANAKPQVTPFFALSFHFFSPPPMV